MLTYTTVADTMEVYHTNEFLGLESEETVGEFFSRKMSEMGNAISELFTSGKTPIYSRPDSVMPVLGFLKELDMKERDALDVARVANMSEYQLDWCKELLEQLTHIKQTNQALYEPIMEWSGRVLNDYAFASKAWADRRIDKLDLKKMQKVLGKHFDGRSKSGNPGITEFGELYANAEDFKRTEKLLHEIHEAARSVDLLAMKENEAVIERNIIKLADLYESGDVEMTDAQLSNLIAVVHQAAAETQYAVALLTYAQHTLGAHNVTIDMIENYKAGK